LVAAVKGVKEKIERYYHKDVVLINETGCKIQGYYEHVSKENNALKILWVGKFDFRKQLRIAIKAIAELTDIKVELHIVGSGTETDVVYYKRLAQSMGVDSMCRWYGMIKNDEVQKIMRESDLLLFTSIMEGTPHVVLEAISNCLPVLCLDTCGQSASINERVGIKMAPTSTSQSAIDFATEIRMLYNDRKRLSEMSKACVERQKELSWNNKARQVVDIYEKLL
jgi:glycosyltransferase involved in cell wall biosynthesis